jgi:hypothetical protein
MGSLILAGTDGEQGDASILRSVYAGAKAIVVIIGIGSIAFYVLALNCSAFVVAEGSYCDGCLRRWRRCAGTTVDEEMYDGVLIRCVGVPVGEWHCRRIDGKMDREVVCP